MAWKLFDFECQSCGHEWEELVDGPENPQCPRACNGRSVRQLFRQGTAARAQVNPAKMREMFQKAAEMRNKVTGKTPWRRNSYSQTGND